MTCPIMVVGVLVDWQKIGLQNGNIVRVVSEHGPEVPTAMGF